MNSEKKTSNAVKILHQRYIGGDSERKASLEQERVGAEVARTIYELREQAGLSQRELAEKVGTTQSVISRLEDSDYEGHSLSMLSRIAKALNRQVQVVMQPKDLEAENVRFAFREPSCRPLLCSRASLRLLRARHLALSVVSRLLRTRLPSPRTSRRFDSPPGAYALRLG
jgi:transcriptional regulator with XRE-family HTH domain